MLISLSFAWDYSSRGINWATEGDPDYVAACAGASQSPINILTEETIQLCEDDLPPLRKTCGDIIGKFKNNGHTLKFEPEDGNPVVSTRSYMSGGPLNDVKYYFWQFHLHWGFWDCPGSEHTVNNNRCSFSISIH